jgi:hypothetical protein
MYGVVERIKYSVWLSTLSRGIERAYVPLQSRANAVEMRRCSTVVGDHCLPRPLDSDLLQLYLWVLSGQVLLRENDTCP